MPRNVNSFLITASTVLCFGINAIAVKSYAMVLVLSYSNQMSLVFLNLVYGSLYNIRHWGLLVCAFYHLIFLEEK